MKTIIKNLCMVLVVLIPCIQSLAHDFEVDGIYYKKTSDNTVQVTYRGNSYNSYSNEYSGSVAIPEKVTYNGVDYSVTSIGYQAFGECIGLINVTIPNSVESIDSYAFNKCNLSLLIIGTGVQSLGSLAYRNDTPKPKKVIWLTNTPPSGYKYYEGEMNYVSNENFKFSDTTSTYVYDYLSSMFNVDGVVYVPVNPSERTCDIINCMYDSTAENITLNDKVTYKGIEMNVNIIRPYSFHKNEHIKNVTANFNLSIPSYCFYGCSKLSNIKLSNNGIVGSYAFSECGNNGTGKLTIAPSVTIIGDCAFYGSKGLMSIELNNIGKINEYAFSECSSLSEINLRNTGSIGNHAFKNCSSAKSLKISPTVTSIGDSAFVGCSSLSDIDLKNKGRIGAYAFQNCTSAKSLKISPTVTSIGSYAFSGCSSLLNIELANTGSIGYAAFSRCSSATSLTTTASVTSIESYAFYGCSSLSEIDLRNCGSIGNYTFSSCSSVKSLTVAPTVTSIGDYAFYGCKALTDVNIENRFIKESSLKFEDWTSTNHGEHSLSEHTWNIDVRAGDVLSFEYWVDSYGSSDRIYVYVDNVQVANLNGRNNNETFTKFYKTDRRTIVKAEFSKSFNYNNKPDSTGIRNIGLNLHVPLKLGSNGSSPLFSSCPLDEVYIGRKLSYNTGSGYGYSPFYRNTSLRSVEISDVETQIYDNEFYGCTNLQNVRIGDGVKSFGKYAFSGCSKIEEFEFGTSVESIGEEAFSDCTGMKKLSSHATVPPTCGTQALDDINKWDCTLYVPASSIDEYKAAAQWKEFFFIEEAAGIESIPADIDETQPMDIYNLQGVKVGTTLEGLTPGIYIIKQGAKTWKHAVR